MNINVIRSNRRTVAIQVNSDLSVTLRVPRRISNREIDRILQERENWINTHIEKMVIRESEYEAQQSTPLTTEEIRDLTERAKTYIPQRVEFFASLIGVHYGRVTIRNQKTRWGSCSGKGNLNFNCTLMLTPPEVIDYVVVHELCHRKQMNHSPAFWAEVEAVIPEYRVARRWLKDQGNLIIRRVTEI